MAVRPRLQSVRSGFGQVPFSPKPGENAAPDQNPYQMRSLKLHEGRHKAAPFKHFALACRGLTGIASVASAAAHTGNTRIKIRVRTDSGFTQIGA
jgi:hypothetical protein